MVTKHRLDVMIPGRVGFGEGILRKRQVFYGIGLFLLFSFGILRSPLVVHAALTDDLQAYWSFEDISQGDPVSDQSGNDNTAVPSGDGGGPTVADAASRESYAPLGGGTQGVAFDGSTQYYTVADDNSLDVTPDMSIAVWIKTTKGTDNYIVYKDNAYGLAIGAVAGSISSGQVGFGNQLGGGGGTVRSVGPTINDDMWHFVVVTFTNTPSQAWDIYIDGDLDSHWVGGVGDTRTSAEDLIIGAQSAATVGTTGFEGSMDDLRIYNRAISSREVLELYGALTDLYAADDGTDENDCTSDDPCDLQTALDTAVDQAVDTAVYLAAGTYTDAYTYNNSNSGVSVTIIGEDQSTTLVSSPDDTGLTMIAGGPIEVQNISFVNNNGNGLQMTDIDVEADNFDVNIHDCTFTGNQRGLQMTHFYLPGSLILRDNTFEDNSVADSGGGVQIADYESSVTGPFPVTIDGNTFTDNEATNGSGGGIGIWTRHDDSTVLVTNNTFTGNDASTNSDGGGMYVSTEGDNSSITIGGEEEGEGNLFENNTAADGSGGGLYAVTNGTDAAATMQGNAFYGNAAYSAGAAAVDTNGSGNVLVIIEDNTFGGSGDGEGNTGTVYIGALHAWSKQALTLSSNTFENNEAGSGTGALQVDIDTGEGNTGTHTISHNSFLNNTVPGSIGAMYMTVDCDCSVYVDANYFDGNEANDAGAARFYLGASAQSPVFRNNVVVNNTATGDSAGGFNYYLTDTAPGVSLLHNTFSGNTTAVNGGAMYLLADHAEVAVDLYNNLFSSNSADVSADDVYVDEPIIDGVTVWNNRLTDICVYDEDLDDVFCNNGSDYSELPIGVDAEDNIDANPQFARGDAALAFVLADDSPMIDAGYSDLLELPETDYSGDDRFFGDRVDIGAFESTSDGFADAGRRSATYQYVKWEITKRGGIDEDCFETYCIQASEFDLLINNRPIAWSEGTVIDNLEGSNPEGEEADQLIDGDKDTKWLDFNFNLDEGDPQTGDAYVVIDLGEGVEFDSYRWATGDDEPDRDPISWKVWGSDDGEDWTLLDSRSNQSVTSDREAYVGHYALRSISRHGGGGYIAPSDTSSSGSSPSGSSSSSSSTSGSGSGSSDTTDTTSTDTEKTFLTADATYRYDSYLGHYVANDSAWLGASPYDLQSEAISQVAPGWYVRGEHYNTVYMVTEDGLRHPFWDTQTFFTYADTWDEIIWVTDATLAQLPLGSPMLPRAGVVLVKIPLESIVYVIDTHAVLHAIPDEATAIMLYGLDWADNVIDLDPTMMHWFTIKENARETDGIDRTIMKTRQQIARLINGN